MVASAPNPQLNVNDRHSALNATGVARVEAPGDADQIRAVLAQSRRQGLSIATAGGRHAMGGQQFLSDGLLLDTTRLDRVLEFDAASGLISAQAGIQWPALAAFLERDALRGSRPWSIRQKQTGADRFSLGGSLSANIHGRGLDLPPLIGDIESFELLDAGGECHHCSRARNADLFALAIGGYGLFGVIVQATLRLQPRHLLRREVSLCGRDQLMIELGQRIADGCSYGDFQFAIDPQSADFLDRGILSCYRPVPDDVPETADAVRMAPADWRRLLLLAHTDKSRAFAEYAAFYRRSHGQVYACDRHQFGVYLDGYHGEIDRRVGHCGSEMITELFVPRPRLAELLAACADDFRHHGVEPIYGTVRLVRADRESFLAWACEDFACVVFNLHVRHDAAGHAHAAAAFQRLIDLALQRGGSYYLTYHRHARRDQLLRAYPQLPAFLRAKRRFDSELLFASDWYRQHCAPLESCSAR